MLPAGPRDFMAWLPMLVSGTVTGALLALDSALDLDLTSVLYPVWQACVAVGLAQALRARYAPAGRGIAVRGIRRPAVPDREIR